MKKRINISGYLLKRGENINPDEIIAEDCKINIFKHKILLGVDFAHSNRDPVGIVQSIKEDENNNLIVTCELFETKPRKLKWWKRILKIFGLYKVPKTFYEEMLELSKSHYEGIGFAYGGIVKEREGNKIKEFDLREVSLIRKK